MREKKAASPLHIPDYELLRLVGRGAYGEVWMARNALGSLRAVKIVWRRNFEDERPYEREFHGIRKFEPVSRKHDGLIDIYHVGRNNEEGCFYYVMELADDAGPEPDSVERYRPLTLREELRARGRLPVARALEIGAKLASALEHLHRAGLVHRDIKPSNIIFVGGTPKLADIGLVAGISDSRSFVGTEGFVPPEGPGSPTADLYSLGKVLYEISTGQDRNDFPKLPPVGPPGHPSGLDTRAFAEFNEILVKACDPELKSRYQSAGELFADLVFLQGGKSLRRVRNLERRTAVLSRVGLVAAVIAVVASFAYFGSFKQIQRAIRAERQAIAHVELLEMQQVEESFRRDDSAAALANLARIIRANPTNRIAVERLLSALTWRNLPLPVAEPIAPDTPLRVAAANPDGREVVSGTADGAVQFWDWQTGSLTAEFQAAVHDILALDWSADRSLLAIGTAEGAVLHDLITDHLTPLATPAGVPIDLIKLSPDQRWVVTAVGDGSARIWDARTGQMTEGVLNHGSRIHRIVFSADSRYIATAGSADGAARIWSTANAEPVTPILRHGHAVNQIAFSPDGRYLATASADGTARIWRSVDGKLTGRLSHRAPVLDVAFSRDGSRLATGADDGTAALWDLETLQMIGRPMAHRASVRSLEFSPDGLSLLTVAGDNSARVWDLFTATPITEPIKHLEPVVATDFSPGGDRLMTAVSAAETSSLWLWKTTSREARSLEFTAGRGKRSVHLQSGPGGAAGLAIVSDRTLRHWSADRDTEPELVDFGIPVDFYRPSGVGERAAVVHGNKAWIWDLSSKMAIKGPLAMSSPISSIDFGPEGQTLALATVDGELRIWHLGAEGQPPSYVQCLPRPTAEASSRLNPGAIHEIQFSPDGRYLVAACEDHRARLFAVTSADLLAELPHVQAVVSAEFSADSQRIVTASTDRHARVWAVPSGRPVGTPMRHDNELVTARFSPDGGRVATAARDWTARVWDPESGKPVSEPMLHGGPLNVVRFSGDGSRLATGAADGSARVWDAQTGLPLTDPFRQAGAVEDVLFTPDDLRLVVVPSSGSVQLFEVPPLPSRAPAWLPDLAEAVARIRINADRAAEPVPAQRLFALKREIDSLPDRQPADPIVRWAKWYLADPELRPISPASALDRAGYVKRLVESESVRSLKEAIWLAPTNALAHAHLAGALLASESPVTYRDWSAANWHQRHARKLSPDDPAIDELCEGVVLRLRSLSPEPAVRSASP